MIPDYITPQEIQGVVVEHREDRGMVEATQALGSVLPGSQQIINIDIATNDEATYWERTWAVGQLLMDAFVIVGSAPGGGTVSAYNETFQVAPKGNTAVTSSARIVSKAPSENVHHTLSDVPTPQRPTSVPKAVDVSEVLNKTLLESITERVSSEQLKVLEKGGRVEVPPGFKDISGFMSEATFATGNEVLLFRAQDGKRYIVMGTGLPQS